MAFPSPHDRRSRVPRHDATPARHAARMGDRLRIRYVCRDEDGVELERCPQDGIDAPYIVLGQEDVLPALEKAFCGMRPGETKTVRLKPSEAFGPYDEELLFTVPLTELQIDGDVTIGMTVELDDDGDPCPGTIVEIDDDCVVIDCNHPMAGKTLTFTLTLLEILSNSR